ncbi:MAG TPA: zinc ribbon domain-containing protein [bacterium]|nr:zinc ribbon domain-containing protein [bacterium]
MPTYEFICRKCGYRFEVFTSISRKAQTLCPQCGSADLRETYSAFYMGGNLFRPAVGSSSCSGKCAACSGTCKTSS